VWQVPHADTGKARPFKEESMVGFIILGIVMLIWVMTWETTGSQA